MNMELERPSATIYQFPLRGRFATGRSTLPATNDALPRMPSPPLGTAWYHDEAIRQERARED
jgi:uncharacterized protein DUF2735